MSEPTIATNSSTRSHYPAWAPRFWHGMRLNDWVRLLARHHFRINPWRWGLAATVTGMTVANSLGHAIVRLRSGRRIDATPLAGPPVFILGHWRSGTTYLHELMSCDDRFATPTTFECFGANHFLLTQAWMPKLLWFLMPAKRPMDNVRTTWDSPQEDEFALCSLGSPSPYLRIAFPNESERYWDYLDVEGLSPAQQAAWQANLHYFLQCLTYAHGKRLILKSPTHTARVGILARMYPDARFLHITRNPLTVYPSTVNLWRVLDDAQGLQIPQHKALEEYVHEAFERMYGAFERQRQGLGAHQILDIRYEDLVADPVGTLQHAYATLQLGDFERVAAPLVKMTQAKRQYQTNRYQLPADQRAAILSRWRPYAERYGYPTE